MNFDRMIEEHSEAPLKVFASVEEFAHAAGYVAEYLAGREKAVPLLKLHGTIENPATCVVSTEQTEKGVGQEKLVALRALLSETPLLWIYVGASMRDLDLRPLFMFEDFARGVDERWVSPYLVDSVEGIGLVREPLWRSTQFRTLEDRLVTETADAFLAAVRKVLQ